MPVFEQDNMAFKTNAMVGWMKRRPAIDKRNQIKGQVLHWPCAILEQNLFYNVQKLCC